MWIHEHENWSSFTWNAEMLVAELANIHYRQGFLLGLIQGLGFDLKQQASLKTLTNDVVKSSAIEGQQLNPEEVRSSIARRLGMDIAGLVPAQRDVDGVVEMMLDATQNYAQPLTKERLFDWHAALFPSGRSGMHKISVANWRNREAGAMQIVSGPIGKETIHFEAPSADRIDQEMHRLFIWLEKETNIDPFIKAGIAHFWFVTIHPFEDGNGRIARAISDGLLAAAEATPERYYSLSTQIEKERENYYAQLERQQRSTPDVTPWLLWFLGCLGRSIDNAEGIVQQVLFKANFWKQVNQQSINARQRQIIRRMLEDNFKGFMNTSKYAKMVKCSNDTAFRDIQKLKQWGIFVQNAASGRSTSYRLTELNNHQQE